MAEVQERPPGGLHHRGERRARHRGLRRVACGDLPERSEPRKKMERRRAGGKKQKSRSGWDSLHLFGTLDDNGHLSRGATDGENLMLKIEVFVHKQCRKHRETDISLAIRIQIAVQLGAYRWKNTMFHCGRRAATQSFFVIQLIT